MNTGLFTLAKEIKSKFCGNSQNVSGIPEKFYIYSCFGIKLKHLFLMIYFIDFYNDHGICCACLFWFRIIESSADCNWNMSIIIWTVNSLKFTLLNFNRSKFELNLSWSFFWKIEANSFFNLITDLQFNNRPQSHLPKLFPFAVNSLSDSISYHAKLHFLSLGCF